jgi:hypothetical protein
MIVRCIFRVTFLDNQEVYQDCNEETGSVLVIEILEYQTTVKDDDACAYFLQDLDVKSENVHDWHDSYIDDTDDDTDDDNEESQLLQEQPKVIDLVYNWTKRYWLPNLKLPPPYNTDDDINHSDKSLKYKDLFVACLGRGHRMDESFRVDIEMCVLRFKSMETDLLITLTTPISSGQVEEAGSGELCNAPIDDDNANSVSTFRQILKSFNIKDWNLFG